jgi:cyclomaltodextrinase / maltogenic alpha-amylase / neopullulanase
VAKAKNPDAFLIGELWDDASPWLQGDEFDGVMNYQFRGACVGFFALENITASRFDSILTGQQQRYPQQSIFALQNLIGSHDTERFLTLCGNDTSKLELSVLFQMTYPGAPMVYYGDEIGLTGGKDPDNRRTMNWDSLRWNMRLLNWYRKMIEVRADYPVFRYGTYQTEFADNNRKLVGFWRKDGNSQALVVLNMSLEMQICAVKIPNAPSQDWVNILTDQIFHVDGGRLNEISVPYHGAVILMPAESVKKQ